MQKNPVLPEWFTKLIDRYQLNQSWLTINVSDVSQLSELSKDQIAFFMSMVKLMRSDLPESQIADEILSLGPREVEEKVTAIDVVISRPQRAGLQVSTINQQVNLNSTEQVQTKIVHIGVQNNFFSTTQFSNMSSTTLKSDGPFRDCFGLPPAFEDFTGREDSLALLEANAGQSTVISHPKKTVSGTGGIGKTQLAVTFAHSKLKQFRETQGKAGYRSIIWFIAGTDEGINNQGLMTEQMHRLGQQLGFDPKQLNPDALVKLIFQRLSEQYGPYLVVYDNAYDYRSIKPYLPPPTVPVVITTRNSNHRDWDQTFKSISLNVFTEKEAHNYIKKVLCRNHANLYQEDEANILAKVLGYFPLALTQALAYITAVNIPLTKYLVEFSQQKAKFLQEPVPQGDPFQEDKNPSSDQYAALPKENYDPRKATVWAVVQLSLKKVINPDAHQILKACAYLAPEAPIGGKLLAYWAANTTECREAIAALSRFSLLENSSVAEHVRIHQLVQEIVRLSDDEEAQGVWLEYVADIMGQDFEAQENPIDDEARGKRLFPHFQAVLAHFESLKEGCARFEREIALLQFYIGNIYARMHNDLDSRQCYETALKALESPGNEILMAKVLLNLGSTNIQLGDAVRAKAQVEQALGIFKRFSRTEDALMAKAFSILGSVARELGDVTDGKKQYELALEVEERANGPNHPDVARALMNLGIVTRQVGDPAGAIELYKRALAIQERAYGPNHPEVATILNNLSNATLQFGDFAGTKELLERALAIQERNVVPDHPELAITLMNLGTATRELGDATAAKKLYQRALAIQERNFGPDHPEVAKTLGNLGNAASQLDDLVGARELYKRALDIQERAFPQGHPFIGITLTNLGRVTRKLRDSSGAKTFLERAIVTYKRTIGENNPDIALTRLILADTLKELGQRDAAIEQYQHSARLFSRLFGDQHPHARKARTMISKLEGNKEQRREHSTVAPSADEDSLMGLIIRISETEIATPEQLIQIARHCIERELISEALVLLEFVLGMETPVSGILLRARCQLGCCDFSGASETALLCQALSEDNDTEVKALLGEIEKSQLQAIQWQARIVELQSLPVFSLRDQVECAINLHRLNRFDEALRILDTVIASRPTVDILAPAYFNRAICYFRLRRYEEAKKSGEESYRLKEHRNVEGLIKKITLAIEVCPKLNELLDQLRHSSTRTLTL